MKTVAIYGRVSTAGQSPESQLQECRAYAERCGYQVVMVYTDTMSGVTGKDDRPALLRLLMDAFARHGNDSAVVLSHNLIEHQGWRFKLSSNLFTCCSNHFGFPADCRLIKS